MNSDKINLGITPVAQPLWTAAACCRFPSSSLLQDAHRVDAPKIQRKINAALGPITLPESQSGCPSKRTLNFQYAIARRGHTAGCMAQ
jgi:hypothetical protein